MDIKGEIHCNTITVGDLNTLLTSMDRSFSQKINKQIMALNVTLDKINLIDIYTMCHSKTAEHTFFSQVDMKHSLK